MRRLIGIVMGLALCVGQAPAWAGFDVGPDGRVVYDGAAYDGPPLGITDVVALSAGGGSLVLALHTFREAPVRAVPGVVLLTWGAWRTATYRPQAVQAAIEATRLARAAWPAVGTAAWVQTCRASTCW